MLQSDQMILVSQMLSNFQSLDDLPLASLVEAVAFPLHWDPSEDLKELKES